MIDVPCGKDQSKLRLVLDNDYEIKPCLPDPQDDPDQNQADAEREAIRDILLDS